VLILIFVYYSVPDSYHIIYPPTDKSVIELNENSSTAYVRCSLNDNIQSTVTVTWLHNGRLARTIPPNEVIQSGDTTTLVIRNLKSSDVGTYQCVFIDNTNGWVLKRSITIS